MGLFLSSHVFGLLPVLCSKRESRSSSRRLQSGSRSIEIAFRVAELGCPNLACDSQRVERHPRTMRLHHNHPLAPAKSETTEADYAGLPGERGRARTRIRQSAPSTRIGGVA